MEDVTKSANKVKKELNKMLSSLDVTLSQLPPDYSDFIVESRTDITRVLNAIKTGEVDPLNAILRKYANTNR